jgi:hypothetical protein
MTENMDERAKKLEQRAEEVAEREAELENTAKHNDAKVSGVKGGEGRNATREGHMNGPSPSRTDGRLIKAWGWCDIMVCGDRRGTWCSGSSACASWSNQ